MGRQFSLLAFFCRTGAGKPILPQKVRLQEERSQKVRLPGLRSLTFRGTCAASRGWMKMPDCKVKKKRRTAVWENTF